MSDDRLSNRVPIAERHWMRRFIDWGVVVFVLALLLVVVLPGVQTSRRGRRSPCNNNLRRLMLALYSYESDFGSFPPAVVSDASGKPLQSWRTLILPYLEQTRLYEELRLDEPWDSEHNRSVFHRIKNCDVFVCPDEEDRTSQPFQTSYLAVAGSETVWPGSESRTLGDVKDGAGNTIMLVEVAESGIDFFEPRDLKFDEMSFKINDPDRFSPGSAHPGGAHVAFCDGSVQFLPDTAPPETLKAMLTIDGGEVIGEY